jgi:phytoene dehydrogenase-like protein
MRLREGSSAVVVGAGPNGLAAAITLAQRGFQVTLLESATTVGGAARSGQATLPDFVHDLGSAVFPLAVASPFFRALPLDEHGLRWVQPPVPLAHPLDGGRAALLHRSVRETAAGLGVDEAFYGKHVGDLVRHGGSLMDAFLGPLRLPRHPITLARFGLPGLLPLTTLTRLRFKDERTRALLAGLGGHSELPLRKAGTSAFALIFAVSAHVAGWPVAAGGAGSVTQALASLLRSLGGTVLTGRTVRSLDDLPTAGATLFDTTPRRLSEIAERALPAARARKLRDWPLGPGVFKLDWALDRPVPWAARECASSATLHIGGTFEEIEAAEAAVGRGEHPDRPFLIAAQPSLFDAARAPEGKHTFWAYTHVPNGSTFDMTERIEAQIERFAPGFRDSILERHVMSPKDLETWNPNLAGGDIGGGSNAMPHILFRPFVSTNPYRAADGIYLCSSSTPPGAGVHGMCGYRAALSVLGEPGLAARLRPR